MHCVVSGFVFVQRAGSFESSSTKGDDSGFFPELRYGDFAYLSSIRVEGAEGGSDATGGGFIFI
jgi:hypothetical protein